MNNTQPPPVVPPVAGQTRQMEIGNWKPRTAKTLRGFFSVTLPSGMILHRLSLHERDDGSRWIGLPSQEYQTAQGERRFEKIVEFSSRGLGDRFVAEILAALDRHFTETHA